MGRDKALLELNGVTLAAQMARLIESVAGTSAIIGDSVRLEGLSLRVIDDDFPGAGPLGGIATALRSSDAEWNLVIACDMPYLTRDWLDYLIARALRSDAEVVMPMNERGAEPLCAMYRKQCLSAIRAALDGGTRKVTDGLAGLRTDSVEPAEWKVFDSEGLLFKNMNSPADYEEAKLRLSRHANR